MLVFDDSGSVAEVGHDPTAPTRIIEVGCTLADITARTVFGVMIFMIARRKSTAYSESQKGAAQPTE